MPDFCLLLTQFGVSRQIFVGVPNANFHENPSSGIRADTRGQAADMTTLICTFFATYVKVPKKAVFNNVFMKTSRN